MTAGTIILWRHGQTDYNIQVRVQGSVDTPLNEAGVAQAVVGARVLARYVDGSRVAIVSSTLSRARETASVLGDVLGLGITFDERLRERGFGLWEGLTREEMLARWPEEFAAWKRGETPRGIGMEPRTAVGTRVVAAVLEHAALCETTDVLVVVSHGSATIQALGRMLALTPGEHFPLRGLDNAHFSVLEHAPALVPQWRLRAHNVGAP